MFNRLTVEYLINNFCKFILKITSFLRTMLTFFENDYAEYRYLDRILFITYKDGTSIDLEAAVRIVKDRLILHEGQSFPILCDIRGIKEINKSARDYLSIEGSVLVKAVAFIIKDPVSEMLSKFYLQTRKPIIPTQSFEHIEDALIFLNGFAESAP
ncbi:hypothetical protein [Yeosuana marina]|uniref:DUF7793 family protein n=1 Tax=Yeosuana marina TaxID=1565536 RepID=UPI0030C7ACA2